MEAMLFAAGLGTRMKPFTDTKPKALLTLNGTTLLEIQIRKLISSGFRHIVINVHHFSDQIVDFIQQHPFDADIVISDESGKLLDTGGGLKYAENCFSGKAPILLHNVDILSDIDLKQMFAYHKEDRNIATLAVSKRSTSRYFLFNEDLYLRGWENILTHKQILCNKAQEPMQALAFSGIHIVSPEIFACLPDGNEAYSIKDAYLQIAGSHLVKGFLHDATHWLDVGKPESMIKATSFQSKAALL